MTGFLIVPNADVTAGQPTTLANALYRPTASLTGLTNGVNYRAFRLSGQSPIFATAAAPSYSFLGNAIIAGSGNTVTLSADVGAASAGKFILIGSGKDGASATDATVTAGATALPRITTKQTRDVCFFGAFIPAESGLITFTVNYTGGAGFQRKAMAVWVLQNISSGTPKQVISGDGTMPVSQQDLVFQFTFSNNDTAVENNNTATQAPARSAFFKVGAETNNTAYSADWTIAAANAAFNFGHAALGSSQRQKISFA